MSRRMVDPFGHHQNSVSKIEDEMRMAARGSGKESDVSYLSCQE